MKKIFKDVIGNDHEKRAKRWKEMSLVLLILTAFLCITVGCGDGSEKAASEAGTENAESLLDCDENVLKKVDDKYREEVFTLDYYNILGNDEIRTRQILSVTFLDSLNDMPEDAWDVSENGDKSVMAWVSEPVKYEADLPFYDLYIAGEGGVNANSDSAYLFSYYVSLAEINFNGCFYTSTSTNMSYMFRSVAVTSVDLSGLDTSSVTNMSYMFTSCPYLTALDLSCFDTSSVKTMSNMFSWCSNLTSLNLSGLDTAEVTDMSEMFMYCTSLEELDLSSFDTSQVSTMEDMFAECTSLKKLNIQNFVLEGVNTEGMYEGTDIDEILNQTWETWQILGAAVIVVAAAGIVIALIIVKKRKKNEFKREDL